MTLVLGGSFHVFGPPDQKHTYSGPNNIPESSRPWHFILTFCQVGVVRSYKKRFRLLLSSLDLNCDLELAVEVQQWSVTAARRRKIEKAEAPVKESNKPRQAGGKQSRNHVGGHVFL